MAVISSTINGDKTYKVLLTDILSHTPSVNDKYYVKMDSNSSSGFSGVFDISNDIANIDLYFTGWLITTTVENEGTFGYIRMALPSRYTVTITADQDNAEIIGTTGTGL